MRILLIDDEVMLLKLIKQTLITLHLVEELFQLWIAVVGHGVSL